MIQLPNGTWVRPEGVEFVYAEKKKIHIETSGSIQSIKCNSRDEARDMRDKIAGMISEALGQTIQDGIVNFGEATWPLYPSKET